MCSARKLMNCLPRCHEQITRGLLQKYGEKRVRDTPITEVHILESVQLCMLN